MKIALLHGYVGGPAGGGGGIRQMLELARGLKEKGHEPVICSYQFEPGTVDPVLESAFEYRSVHTGKIEHPVGTPAMLKVKWIEMAKLANLIPRDVDVVNVHESPAHMAGYYAHLRRRLPIVWTRNDPQLYEMVLMPEESWMPSSGRLMDTAFRVAGLTDRAAARAMSAICVLDERNARLVKRAYGRDAKVIRSGAAPRFFNAPTRAEARAELGIDPDEFAVLSVGILLPHRRHKDTVRAVAMLSPEGRKPHLRIIGSDHLSPETGAEMREFVAQSGIEDRVEQIQTAVPDDQLLAHFAAADAFVFANEKQTWGLAPLEAIAAGTPVVVSRGAGVHEVLDGRKGVQLVDARAPEQIAAALERIRSSPEDQDVTETREWSRQEFSSSAFSGRMADLFASVVG
ncbi:MAG: glycosyltransferase family 4 protein [Thermoleophilaceae bacterium]|nr:glycosyltransferase family 4 protein [Thermoleophilaceae bacterium]